MSRQDWLNDDPSDKHKNAVENAILPELKKMSEDHRSERAWRWLIALVPVGAAAMAMWWVQNNDVQQNETVEPEFLAMAEVDELVSGDELELLEDLEMFEDLEDLESWNS